MATKTLYARIINKHETEEHWLAATGFTPLEGEVIVYCPDDKHPYARLKVGNNIDNVNDLPFITHNSNGGKAYKILSYNFTTSQVLDPNVSVYEGSTTLVLNTVEGISVGNIVNIEMNDSSQRFATVQNIDNSKNAVILSKAFFDESIETGDVSNSNCFLVLPELENKGDSVIGNTGYNFGINNRTLAEYTFVTGEGNSAEGRNAFVSGENNIGGYNALVGGEDNVVSAEHGFGVGYKNTATARYAAAIGYNNDATGPASMAIGDNTTASGVGTLAQGYNTTASGSHSHAEGASTKATGVRSHAEGYGSEASGYAAHAEGYYTKALHDYSHAEGANTTASGKHAHAEGDGTVASKEQAHSEGLRSVASGENSHAEGADTKAEKAQAHAEGFSTTASGFDSHAEGRSTTASGDQSHAEGLDTLAEGVRSHAEGEYTKATGSRSHAEGYGTLASAWNSHAEGADTQATGQHSHAEGFHTLAKENGAHAEGEYTQATGSNAHAEGIQTKATGAFSHAENCYTEATGARSHAEGNRAKANGESSHAGGHYSQANGKYSFAHGEQVIAGQQSQFVVGAWNSNKTDTLFEVGNGTSESHRVNAFEVRRDNNAYVGTRKLATEAVVDSKIAALVDSAPAELNTLKELADALNDQEDIAAEVVTTLATKADKSDLDNKVDKVDGKGLSTNDFTNAYKNQLDNEIVGKKVDSAETCTVYVDGLYVTVTDPIAGNGTAIKLETVETEKKGANLGTLFAPMTQTRNAPLGYSGESVYAATSGYYTGSNGGICTTVDLSSYDFTDKSVYLRYYIPSYTSVGETSWKLAVNVSDQAHVPDGTATMPFSDNNIVYDAWTCLDITEGLAALKQDAFCTNIGITYFAGLPTDGTCTVYVDGLYIVDANQIVTDDMFIKLDTVESTKVGTNLNELFAYMKNTNDAPIGYNGESVYTATTGWLAGTNGGVCTTVDLSSYDFTGKTVYLRYYIPSYASAWETSWKLAVNVSNNGDVASGTGTMPFSNNNIVYNEWTNLDITDGLATLKRDAFCTDIGIVYFAGLAEYDGELFNDYSTNIVSGGYSHVEGANNEVNAVSAHAEGQNNRITEKSSRAHVEGYNNTVSARNAHAEGANNEVSAPNAHVEGLENIAEGKASHAEGTNTLARGVASHAEGIGTRATAYGAHAEGHNTLANGVYSHAEGDNTIVNNGNRGHAEGYFTEVGQDNAHAEGCLTKAMGISSHAEGWCTEAKAAATHAAGIATVAGYEGQTVVGIANENKADNLFEVGNGEYTAENSKTTVTRKSNAFEVKKDGTAIAGGKTLATEVVVDTKITNQLNPLKESLANGDYNVQSDWTNNDETSKAYVLNRTHYGASEPTIGGLIPGEHYPREYWFKEHQNQTVVVHRHNSEIDEWYSLPVGQKALDTETPVGCVEVEEKFIIWDHDFYLTYKEYSALSAAEQQAYFESFDSFKNYWAWYNIAKQKYDFDRQGIIIGGSGSKIEGPQYDAVCMCVTEYDESGCTYEIYDEIAPATKVLHPSYLPMNVIASEIQNEVMASIVDSAPETLNTLNELAAALGDDPNFATTVSNRIGLLESGKVDKVEGKGLSTNDFTNAYKEKLDNIENLGGNVSTGSDTPMEIITSATQPTPVEGKTIIWIDISKLS